MKNRILAACLAALAFASCDEPTPTPRPRAVTRVETPRPKVEPVVQTSTDAGQFVAPVAVAPAPKPPEPLALPHEQPLVDHLVRARTLKEDGDLKGALTEARRAVYSTPSDEETLAFTAKLATLNGRHGLAADAWAMLAEVRTEDPLPRVQEARSRLKAKDDVGAAVAAQDAVARDEGSIEGYQALGRAELSRGNLKLAITAFEKVVSLNPEHGYALNNLGLTYLRANENEKALEVLTRAAELLPQVAYVQNNLGVALERNDRPDEAKAAYELATSLSPKYIKARVNQDRVAKAMAEPKVDLPEPDPEIPADAVPVEPEVP